MPTSLAAVPLRLARRARRILEHALLGRQGFLHVPVGTSHAGGRIDGIETGHDGVASVIGWAADPDAFAAALRLRAGGAELTSTNVFRVTRPDLALILGDARARLGLVVEFTLPAEWSNRPIELVRGHESLAKLPATAWPHLPYSELHANPGVRHREHIYAVGPPVCDVSNEILELCADLPGPLLDFGCGAGALVDALLNAASEAIPEPVVVSEVVKAAGGRPIRRLAEAAKNRNASRIRGGREDAPGVTRTRDPRIRNPVLYPPELRGLE